MNRILVQAVKEWAEFKRDRLSLALAFLLPLATLLLFSYGVRMQSHDIPVLIQDSCNTSLSRSFIERLEGTSLLHRVSLPQNTSVEAALNKGLVKAAILIPQSFQKDIFAEKTAVVQTLVDGTDIMNARFIELTVEGAAMYLERSMGVDPANTKIKANLRIWFNPGMKEFMFIVPGACGIVLWMFPSLLACVATAREREQGTVMQIFVSRIKAHEMVLGKALFYQVIGLLQAALIICAASMIFGLKFAGNPTAFLITVPIFVFSSVLFGLAVGSCSDSQTTAVQGVSSLGFFTCLLLSGFVYPISNIPYPLSLLSYLVPSRYFMEVSRDAFERGIGWSLVWFDPLALVAFCGVFFFISWNAWRRMQFKV